MSKTEIKLFRKGINGEMYPVDTSKKTHFVPKRNKENKKKFNIEEFLGSKKCELDHKILKQEYKNYNYCPICGKSLPSILQGL